MPSSTPAEERHAESWSSTTVSIHTTPTIAQTQHADDTHQNTPTGSNTSPSNESVLLPVDSIPGPPYRCPHPKCKGKQYALRSVLKKHYRHHTKPVPCDVLDCPRGRPGQGFASRKDMEKHCWVEHRLHAETKGFRSTEGYCDLCGQLLRRKDNIIKHQKRSCRSRLK